MSRTDTDSNTPVAVLGGHTFASISAGYFHTVVRTPAGEAYAWGRNSNGELGDGSNTSSNAPVAVLGGVTFQL